MMISTFPAAVVPASAANVLPAADRFVIYDDGSAVVNSKHDTHYALQFFERPDGIVCPHCDCKRSRCGKECRHRRKLKAILSAQGRIEAVWGGVNMDLDLATAEDECPTCKEFIAQIPLVYVLCSPGGNSGYLSLRVCKCGAEVGARQNETTRPNVAEASK